MQNFGLFLEITEVSGISPFCFSKDKPNTDAWNSHDLEKLSLEPRFANHHLTDEFYQNKIIPVYSPCPLLELLKHKSDIWGLVLQK